MAVTSLWGAQRAIIAEYQRWSEIEGYLRKTKAQSASCSDTPGGALRRLDWMIEDVRLKRLEAHRAFNYIRRDVIRYGWHFRVPQDIQEYLESTRELRYRN